MQEHLEVTGSTLKITLPAELDHPVSDAVRKEADRIMERTYIRNIVFDFKNTGFMDSSGIGLIMGRYRALGMRGNSLKAIHVNARMEKILHLSGVHKFIEIIRDEDVSEEGENEMEHTNEMTLMFDSRPVNEGLARVSAAAFCTQLNPTLEEVADLKTAVSEAVTNCIIHGYEGRLAKIEMHCRLSGKEIQIDVKDWGKGIPDIRRAMEPLFTTKPEKERSGMGFTFMEAFMDEVSVESEVGKGTTVHMKKIIGR